MRAQSQSLTKCFSGKSVLVTGHTGFKGSWLTAWLQKLGARVTGLSIDVPTSPSHFGELGLAKTIDDRRLDIRDAPGLREAIVSSRPDFVFHLAAQSLVRRSYRSPLETFETNALGTASLLEALRVAGHRCTVVIITSDKCYDNVEWNWGYRETDRLGGKDPYSGSKGAAELIIRSYVSSFFSASDSPVRVAVGRAGNVVGGGDWAEDRIVPDCIRAWAASQPVNARNPRATRPWQHVLEPLSGYLWLAAMLCADAGLNGEAFNFGPSTLDTHTVQNVIDALGNTWSSKAAIKPGDGDGDASEAGLLKLNCDKAFARLGWRATLDFQETMTLTGEWYDRYHTKAGDVLSLTTGQIEAYEALARKRMLPWAR